jgi:protein-S-isoprenylcysteine O-methyltransferase Ste14
VYLYILAYLLIVGFFTIEFLLRKGRAAKSFDAQSIDRGSTRLIGLTFTIALVLPLLLNYFWPFSRFNSRNIPGIAGLAAMLAGLLLRIWSMTTLGKFYTRTLLVTDRQEVVQSGPYRMIRNPGYLGSLLIWIGLELALNNWLAMVLVALLMSSVYVYRIHAEEVMMVKNFGNAYQEYMRCTWRIIPFIY